MYKKYQNARNASWQLLIDFNISELPVKVSHILKQLNIKCCSYEKGAIVISDLGFNEKALITDGFAVNMCDNYYVFYNQELTSQRCKFVIAHELGHILLNHVNSNCCTVVNKEPSDTDVPQEKQANIFATRLLSPACVLHELNVKTAKQISSLCQITEQSAKFRLKRLKLVEKRNQKFLDSKGYGTFYLNPLEKQVYNKFKEYIDKTIL